MERLYIYNMKKILIIVVLLIATSAVNAQQNKLVLDEHNKYIYYEVVDAPGASADSLNKNGKGFIEHNYPKDKPVYQGNDHVSIRDKFLTYSALVKHENGEIAYTLNVEYKDDKYRYWLTDFLFTPYERNRYGMYVPVNGVNTPLEITGTKITKKELDDYLAQANAFCKQLGEKLKKYMVEAHTTPRKTDQQAPKKIVTDKW